ncbi:MAG: hypothetical protein MI757_10540 [Pirellulales bacterium]|nr:hypothetical protein [Pirellulales bacterium]
MLEADVLALLIVGIVFVLVSVVALTSFGGKFPKTVLVMMFVAFAAYMSVILVRLEMIDIKSWIPGAS